jgi:hypothetical protein
VKSLRCEGSRRASLRAQSILGGGGLLAPRTYETSELGARRSFGHVLNDQDGRLVLVRDDDAHDSRRPSGAMKIRRGRLAAWPKAPSQPADRREVPSFLSRKAESYLRGWLSSFLSRVRNVRSRPSGIVSPVRQFVTVLSIVGGSAGAPLTPA